MPDLKIVWILAQVEVQYGFLEQLKVLLPIILDDPRQYLVRYRYLLQLSTENKCLEVLEVPLLDPGLGEHAE